MTRSWEDLGVALDVNETAEHDIRTRMDAHGDARDKYRAVKREVEATLAAKYNALDVKDDSLRKELRENSAERRALLAERETVRRANAQSSR